MRITHVSDLHARRKLPGTSQNSRRLSRRIHDALQTAINDIRQKEPDLLVVTGDLLDFPFYGFDDPWLLDRAVDDLRTIAETLDTVSCPKAVLGGNHDHPEAIEKVFGASPDDFEVAGHRVLTFNDHEVIGNTPQRLDRQRRRFLGALRDPSPLPQIHIQHYVVWPELNKGYHHSYKEAESLKDAIADSGVVRLVLSGHYHPGMAPFKEGGAYLAIAPAFCGAPHPYIIYDISDDSVDAVEYHANTHAEPPSPVVFLDRDGTITKAPSYSTGPDEIELIDGAADAIAKMRQAGLAVVVVSNQSCVGLGYVTEQTVASVNDRMARLLIEQAAAAEIDGVYCSFTHPDAVLDDYRSDDDADRKPNPGLLRRASDELGLDLNQAYMVGDRPTDLEAGRAAGTKTVLVRTGGGRQAESEMGQSDADLIADDLSQAANWIVGDLTR